jgi:hypothetical protein
MPRPDADRGEEVVVALAVKGCGRSESLELAQESANLLDTAPPAEARMPAAA